jgi:putative N6-adenine-specific DNA methylase
MKGLAITHKGFEDICAKEINELVKTKTKVLEGCVEFEIEKLEDLCLIAYKAQSIIKILYYIDSCEYSEIEDLKKLTDKIDFDQWFNEETTFVVRCKRMDDTDESTQYIESQMGEYILEKKKLKVELKQPDVTFFVYICESKAYFGIDMTATELSKRQYKIYLHPEALKGTMGYCLYRMSDAKVGDVILDPFCGSGTILIETALHQTQFPVNYFNKQKFAFLKFKPLKEVDFDKFFTEIDKQAKENKKITLNGFDHQLRYVTSSKNNAKIAGIEKNINFARADAEWLDTKMEEEQVDWIITDPPMPSAMVNPQKIQKVYEDFFYQAEFILKKQGKVIVITRNTSLLKQIAEQKKFKIEHERQVWSGKQEYSVIIFSK